MDPAEQYFNDRFNTPLSSDDEAKYQTWLAAQSKADGRDRSLDQIDYDTRGFWKNGEAFAENGHGSDRYKKPNHMTFSDQSQYHNAKDDNGTVYVGGTWSWQPGGKFTYTPSAQMLQATHDPKALQDYFNEYEAGNTLIFPGQ